mgnify:CR=1 FL=1
MSIGPGRISSEAKSFRCSSFHFKPGTGIFLTSCFASLDLWTISFLVNTIKCRPLLVSFWLDHVNR